MKLRAVSKLTKFSDTPCIEHAPYYAGHPVVKSQHENGAFAWLKIALVCKVPCQFLKI